MFLLTFLDTELATFQPSCTTMRTYAGDCENGSFEFLRAQGWNGGDLYKLAKTLGHANIKMTERYANWARRISRVPETRRAECGN